MAFEKDKDKEKDNFEEELEEVLGEVADEESSETTENDNNLALINEELTLKLTRMQADYANLKRRSEIERKGSVDFGIESLACELLPVIDNFERALEAEEDKENSFYKGITMIYNQLIEILNKMSIEEIQALNNPFDPNCHNAIMVEESEGHEEDIVIGVLQKGYKFKDKVIRPSMVKVSK
ncbi:MAG: nucleotide exchange factor GrpE [Tissierellaceae bacterium]|nr:nucleotide exchange factor GrpE [Tissierellaceae bacterium]